MPVASRDVRAVQASYPRIDLACHVQHLHRTPARANLTETESGLLAHLDERRAVRASELARLAQAADRLPRKKWSEQ